MPDTIRDGKGRGNLASVTSNNKLRVYATQESEVSYESETNERAYTWTHAYSYGANDTILWLRNDSSILNLIVDKIIVSSNTTTQFKIHAPLTTTTPTGTVITGKNINLSAGNTADATAYGDETGNTLGTIILQGILSANTTLVVPVEGGIILSLNNEIAIDFVTIGTLGLVTIKGYYHSIK